ncbi:MAG TPA: ABC transporter substrate-binding protein [Candidatus Binatia bacterium]|nr:ABC transporter substrate-binding protein [Candidatus Binatia bacterium]
MKHLPLSLIAFVLAATAAAATPPDEVIKTATAQVQDVIKQRQAEFKAEPAKFYTVVDQMVAPHFDLPYITQLILGKYNRSATAEQRDRFQAAFKNMLIRSYANALLEYGAQVKTEWAPLRMAADASTTTVQSKVIRPRGAPVPMGFAMKKNGEDWKIYDITVDNVSLITGFRGQVTSQIKSSSLDQVIAQLEQGGKITPAGAPKVR